MCLGEINFSQEKRGQKATFTCAFSLLELKNQGLSYDGIIRRSVGATQLEIMDESFCNVIATS